MSTVDEILKEVESGVFIPESYVSILACEVKRLDKRLRSHGIEPRPAPAVSADGWQRIGTAPIDGRWFRGRNAAKREFDVRGDGSKHQTSWITYYDRDGLIREPREWNPSAVVEQ